MPLSVELSRLCLGWPCFRFRGFEKSWFGCGEGSLGPAGILGARGSWEEHLARHTGCGSQGESQVHQDSAAALGTSEAIRGLGGCTDFTSHMLWRKMKQAIS